MQHTKIFLLFFVIFYFHNAIRAEDKSIPWPPSADSMSFGDWINSLNENEKIAAAKELFSSIEDNMSPEKKFSLVDGKLIIEGARVNANDIKWISSQTHCTYLHVESHCVDSSFFASLANHDRLSELSIDGPVAIDQAGLNTLSKIKTLKKITLSEPDDGCLISFARLPYIEKVNIQWLWGFTDDGLRAFARSPNLRFLSLLDMTEKKRMFTGEGLSSLTQVQSLSINDVNGFEDNRKFFEAISAMQNLRHISLTFPNNKKIRDQDFAPIEKIKSFEELHLTGPSQIDGSFLVYLKNSTALSKISLANINGSKLDFNSISNAHNMTYLNFDGIKMMSEKSWQSISCFENLTELHATSSPNIGAGPDFSKLKSLSKIDIAGCGKLNSVFFKNLSNATYLRSLSIDSTNGISINDLIFLKNLKTLNEISIVDCTDIDDSIFEILGTLSELISLNLVNMPKLTGNGIHQLANTKIRVLSIDQKQVECWQLSDEVLNELMVLIHLDILNIETVDDFSKEKIEKMLKIPVKTLILNGKSLK